MIRPALIFLLGVFGSVAVEVLHVVSVYEAGKPLPSRYRRPGFWVARSLIALFAGVLAVAYDVRSPILAIHVGASTPIIIETFTRKPPVGSIEQEPNVK